MQLVMKNVSQLQASLREELDQVLVELNIGHIESEDDTLNERQLKKLRD